MKKLLASALALVLIAAPTLVLAQPGPTHDPSSRAAYDYARDAIRIICVDPASPVTAQLCGLGGGGGSLSATASAGPTAVTAGANKALNEGLFSNLFVTQVTPGGAQFDPTSVQATINAILGNNSYIRDGQDGSAVSFKDVRAVDQALSSTLNSTLIFPYADGQGTISGVVQGIAGGGQVIFEATNNFGAATPLWTTIKPVVAGQPIQNGILTADSNFELSVGGRSRVRVRTSTGGSGSMLVAYTISPALRSIVLGDATPAGGNLTGIVKVADSAAAVIDPANAANQASSNAKLDTLHTDIGTTLHGDVIETHAAAGSDPSKADSVQGCTSCKPVSTALSAAVTGPTSTLTLPATTTAYGVNTLIASSATAGSVVVPSFSISNAAGGAAIGRLRLSTNDATSTAWPAVSLQVDLWTSAAPTFTNGDRGAWALATGAANHLAAFSCTMSAEYGDGAYAECVPVVGSYVIPKLASGSTIYWSLKDISASGVTGASKVFTLTAELLN